ncbi:MAG: penicillin-binding protein 2 [Kiritimatiellia bacterium]
MKTSPWFVLALAALYVFGFFILSVKLFRLQVSDVALSIEDGTRQATRRVRVPGMRGRIVDRQGRVLADCRPSHCIRCDLEEFQRRGNASNTVQAVDEAVERVSRVLKLPRTLRRETIARHVRTASAMPITVFQDLDDASFAKFHERADEFPGFEAFTNAERTYPYGSLAAHVLGYTGRGSPESDPDDPVHFCEPEMKGREGIERFYNSYLTGRCGEMRLLVDARGFRPRKSQGDALDGRIQWIEHPSPGLDLQLTLDIALQAVVERELHSVTGACVVLDPRDGAVLAMASAPTFNPNRCVPRLSPDIYAGLTNAPAKCGQNRAMSESYAPGSTFKPITALASLATGWASDDEYDCQGVYRLGNLRLHCWDRYGHGPIAVREALEQSCNTFFCNLGSAVGTNAIIEAARSFGLGSCTGIDLGGETPGVVPDDVWKRRQYNEPWYPGDTCQMSIGQGMLLVTPLQMAVVAAALANGGRIYTPYLHLTEGMQTPQPVRVLAFDAEDFELVRRGMRDVAETGTGKRILERRERIAPDSSRWRRFLLNVPCAGKTGTAEIGRGETKRKNTWVIAFAPYDAPTIAVAMIVERGESGGFTVAPRVHAILASVFGEREISSVRMGDPNLERRD